jgi:chorismate dehydratase
MEVEVRRAVEWFQCFLKAPTAMDDRGMGVDPLRIGVVSYLNARPLYFALLDRLPGVRLVTEVPSRLAEMLAGDAVDVALVPSIEYLRAARRRYVIVPGISIAARGAARSVKLFSRVPLGEVRRLALDEGSRTSQALARIWLEEAHGVRPGTIEPLPLGVSPTESSADAVMVIGDRAMAVPRRAFAVSVDLGEAWFAVTGLPFVFAVWAARSGVDLGDLPGVLRACKSDGLAHAEELAREHAPRLGLSVAGGVDYLTRNLSYDLGEAELAGLRLFARKASAIGLCPEGVDLVFAEGCHDPAPRR